MKRINECAGCNWMGTHEAMKSLPLNGYQSELVCPNCGHDEFYCREVQRDTMEPLLRLCQNLEQVYEQEKHLLERDFLNHKLTEQEYGVTMALLEHDLAAIKTKAEGIQEYTRDGIRREAEVAAT